MITTVGIFLVDNRNRILLGHATRAPLTLWTIPKGIQEATEQPIDTALREFREETNIDLSEYRSQLRFIGSANYPNDKKRLYAFFLRIPDNGDKRFPNPKCISMVDEDPPFPEVDNFRWATYDEAVKLSHSAQKQILEANKGLFR